LSTRCKFLAPSEPHSYFSQAYAAVATQTWATPFVFDPNSQSILSAKIGLSVTRIVVFLLLSTFLLVDFEAAKVLHFWQ
jgi:hypothetical protein